MIKVYLHENKYSLNGYLLNFKRKRLKMKKFRQLLRPDWCEYIEALSKTRGCLSLIFGSVKDFEFCKGCEFCNNWKEQKWMKK